MVARVIREAVRYAKNNAAKRVAAKNSRKAANDAKKRGSIRRTEKVKTKRKPPKGIPIPPKPEKMSKAFQTKSGAKKLLRKFGVPGKIIAGVLALTAVNQLNKPKTTKTKTKTPRPGNKSNAPNPFTKINPPAKRRGPGRPTMTSMVAKIPTPRNKNVTKRPKRPSKQGSFGR